MPKLLIRRQKRKGVQETFYIKDPTQDYHSKYGKVSATDLSKPDGSLVKSHTDEEFYLFTSNFIDEWSRLRRIPQSMIAKDIGTIITTCGIGKESVVAEAGSGNASLGTQLAHICKHVHSFDIKEAHLENAKKNAEKLGMTNMTFYLKDIATHESDDKVDVLILDVPQPWDALASAYELIKPGGWLVTYSPSTTQVQQTFIDSQDKFLPMKTVETIEREWSIGTRICRPGNIAIGHTAFLSFYRKL